MSRFRRWLTASCEVTPGSAVVLLALTVVMVALVALRIIPIFTLVLAFGLLIVAVPEAIGTLMPAREIRIHERVILPFSASTVWELIAPAEKAPLINPNCVRGYRVENTPEGVGEQQAMEYTDGSISVIEVLEWVPGRSATIVTLSPPSRRPTKAEFDVAPLDDGGCSYDHTIVFELPRGKRLNRMAERQVRAGLTEMFDRIAAVLSAASA